MRKDDVVVVPVVNVDVYDMEIKSFDEVGAVYERDKDNVRLNFCPPPFSLFFKNTTGYDKSKAMALASKTSFQFLNKSVFLKRANIIDKGAKLDSVDMRRILDYPFPQQKELEKTMSRADRAEAMFGHIGRDDGGLDRDSEYGD